TRRPHLLCKLLSRGGHAGHLEPVVCRARSMLRCEKCNGVLSMGVKCPPPVVNDKVEPRRRRMIEQPSPEIGRALVDKRVTRQNYAERAVAPHEVAIPLAEILVYVGIATC